MKMISKNKPLCGAARQAFGSFVRAYATHSVDTKGIFRVQVNKQKKLNIKESLIIIFMALDEDKNHLTYLFPHFNLLMVRNDESSILLSFHIR